MNGLNTTVERTFWHTLSQGNKPVDLRADPQYSGRVQYRCDKKSCTLRITDLRESDSAEYKFRFITNQHHGEYSGSPGVTLTVTGLQASTGCRYRSCSLSQLKCQSSCRLPDHSSYVWYKNGEKIQTYLYFSVDFDYADSISCAVAGHEDSPSPPVCVRSQSCNKVTYADRRICAFKGSSVDISCTYNRYNRYIRSKLWFSPGRSLQWQSPSQLDSQHRVQVLDEGGRRSTLRISDLRESDSAEYRFTFTAGSFEWGRSLPATTLTVTDPDLQVQVIWSLTGPKLVCHSSCLTNRSSFIWYENGKEIREATSPSYRGHVDPANNYSCGYKNYRSLPVYVPTIPIVSKSPPGDIMKNSSVSLTCTSEANPVPKYYWYKNNQTLLSEEPQLVLNFVQSSDSGDYYCTAENELGKMKSEYISVNVKYGPETSTLSVCPSAKIVEGSSVTLNCSSDANPAANYTWYKDNQTLIKEPQEMYHFISISSEDTGSYHCKSENQYGQINSSSLFIDVQYGPKLPSVSVSPSAEIVEGSSVTLSCSSDANPAANYTWYKENEDSPKASGQNFTITDFRAEHSGNYYCEAQNIRGSHKNTLHLTIGPGAKKSAAIGTTTAFLLVIIILAVLLWMRRNTQHCEGGQKPICKTQLNMSPVYDNTSAVALRQPAEQQDDLHYASICLAVNQEVALYSNISLAHPHRQIETEYSTIKTDNDSSALRTRHQKDRGDSFALYSTVNKNYV
uniref:B-cell receptor CD22-like n=1 Tax=Scatophagus argus TaxID=75038 RepID=UPI001ED83AD8|nr:B-cell receptor CD22-like [Scatophagus argus]